MTKLIGIVGTNSKQSTNRTLIEFIQHQYHQLAEIEKVEIANLPFCDYTNEDIIPDLVLSIIEKIKNSDGLIISIAEYDHAPTAALINFFTWLSIFESTIEDKPVFLTSCAHGTLGALRAQHIVRQILLSPYLKADVFNVTFTIGNSTEAFDENNQLKPLEKKLELDNSMKEFISFINLLQ